jgi:hypothetical protein
MTVHKHVPDCVHQAVHTAVLSSLFGHLRIGEISLVNLSRVPKDTPFSNNSYSNNTDHALPNASHPGDAIAQLYRKRRTDLALVITD